ncbi:hypothetical protein [Marinobacter sediminum]|uniref:hypothetical protein n=1 Tax=Marinobacter sediminum TaxID=256323 RepID=UPI00356491E1
MKYEHAIVKFEGDVGVLLCNGCGVVIAEGKKHEDREHNCAMCMSGNCKAKFEKREINLSRFLPGFRRLEGRE